MTLLCTGVSSHAQITHPTQANIITTIAGDNSSHGYGGDNGPATAAQLYKPEFLRLDKSGNIYISDCGNSRVRKIALDGIITTIAGNGSFSYNGDTIAATNAALDVPEGVCADSVGNVYIADFGNNRIRKVDVATGTITTIAGIGPNGAAFGGYSGDNGPATDAGLNNPCGLAVDRSGNIYIGDYSNDVVRRVDGKTGIITTFAGVPTSLSSYAGGYIGYSGDGGQATKAVLSGPIQVFCDSVGNVFICDQWNYAVRKVDIATNIITTVAGNGHPPASGIDTSSNLRGDGHPATDAELDQPSGMFIDRQGNMFIDDYGDGTIRKVDAITGIISTVAGTGLPGFSGDGGLATAAQLAPGDVCVADDGTIYIADEDNNRIRKVYNPALAVPAVNVIYHEVRFFPNPAQGTLNIAYSISEGGEALLLDVTGHILLTADLSAQRQQKTIDISSLPPGEYICQVLEGLHVISKQKIVKIGQ